MNVKTKPKLNKIANQIKTQINTMIQQICPLHEQLQYNCQNSCFVFRCSWIHTNVCMLLSVYN